MTAGNGAPMRRCASPQSRYASGTTATGSTGTAAEQSRTTRGASSGGRVLCVLRHACRRHLRPAAAGNPRSHAVRGRRGGFPDHRRKSAGALPPRDPPDRLRRSHARGSALAGGAHRMLPGCSRARCRLGRRHRHGHRGDAPARQLQLDGLSGIPEHRLGMVAWEDRLLKSTHTHRLPKPVTRGSAHAPDTAADGRDAPVRAPAGLHPFRGIRATDLRRRCPVQPSGQEFPMIAGDGRMSGTRDGTSGIWSRTRPWIAARRSSVEDLDRADLRLRAHAQPDAGSPRWSTNDRCRTPGAAASRWHGRSGRGPDRPRHAPEG